MTSRFRFLKIIIAHIILPVLSLEQRNIVVRNFWRNCRPTWTPSARTWRGKGWTTEMTTAGTVSECNAFGPRTWPRPCYGRPIRTSARYRTAVTTMATTTPISVGGLAGENAWRTASNVGWCHPLVGGYDRRSNRAADCTRTAKRAPEGRPTLPVTGRTRCWYVVTEIFRRDKAPILVLPIVHRNLRFRRFVNRSFRVVGPSSTITYFNSRIYIYTQRWETLNYIIENNFTENSKFFFDYYLFRVLSFCGNCCT